MTTLPDIRKINVEIDTIENNKTKEKNVSVSLLRLDKIHPDIPGNKFFKLYYFLQKAIAGQKKIITFGGAYSNHLAATAKACNLYQLNCIGIVRGEEPLKLSHTLLFCRQQGMQLVFISRKAYEKKHYADFKTELVNRFEEHILIPEGGYDNDGVNGAALIPSLYTDKGFTHICCPAGTASTLAGIIKSSFSENIIGFSALKNLKDFDSRIQFLLGNTAKIFNDQ
jgi:1-aminocyclopropane-1-carboxylate deaminase